MSKTKKGKAPSAWPNSGRHRGAIDLHILPSVAAINGARIRELTGDKTIPETTQVILRTFKAVVGHRTFHVGFCLGDGASFSAIGVAVIERLMMEAPGATLHVVPIVYEDIAWDLVIRHLQSFTGQVLLFAFRDSDVYDAGTAEISYTQHIRQFDSAGVQLKRLTEAQRRRIREHKASMLGRPVPPRFYPISELVQEETPWIFRLVTPAGKVIRTSVWDGRRDYAHEIPEDILRWVGGDKLAIVQVDKPVGVDRRSSLDLTHVLARKFDSVIHWARDTETFQSILKSFIRLDLESVDAPETPDGWKPEVTILAANGKSE